MTHLREHPLARFFAVLLVVYGAWFAAYDLVLKPDGRLDAAVAHAVAATAGVVLDGLGLDGAATGRQVRCLGGPGVLVEDGCNGLAALGLFVGFVLAYPGAWRRRLWFLPAGLAVVYGANVARVASLAYFTVAWPEGFDLLHGVGTSTFFYLVIFGLWVAWAHVGAPRPGAPPEPPSAPVLAVAS